MRYALLLPAALLLLSGSAPGAPEEKRPHIGYLFAAGGQRGTTVAVTAGGQNLRGAKGIHVTGEGVSARIVKYHRPTRIKSEQLRELGRQLRECRNRIVAAASDKNRGRNRGNRGRKRTDEKEEEREELPDHPLLKSLESMNLRELKKVSDVFFDPTRRQQISPQISEQVELEVLIEPDAEPGYRELRILTAAGLSNPLPFEVGVLPETREREINDFSPEALPALGPALVLNGQVSVRDIDRFRFRAKKGRRLVIEARARKLVPFLADAVPGWFQAVMTLRDEAGTELAFVDDFWFDPDPVLLFEVPADGLYELEIRDSIYRGRADFVYRVTIGEQPFVTSMFPLGGRVGTETVAQVEGWNLPSESVALDTAPGARDRRETVCRDGDRRSNGLPYAVGDIPEAVELEPNDDPGRAQPIMLPRMLNGRIGHAGDIDVYRFTGKAGDEVVAEVHARRLGSPVDSMVTLTDASGGVLARNDDLEDQVRGYLSVGGLSTHHADSYLRARLPADGVYCVKVTETTRRGGPEFAYRLRLSAPRPDFRVVVSPSALNVPAGSVYPVKVHVLRKDGFTGAIDLTLEGAPRGFALAGARIPAGRDQVRMTLQAPAAPLRKPIPLTILGRAKIGDRTVVRPAVGGDDIMQAFLWRHLVPTEELLVTLTKTRAAMTAMTVPRDPIRIPLGGKAMTRIPLPGRASLDGVKLVLDDPPPGVALWDVGLDRGAVVLVLAADAEKAVEGAGDNLILEVYREYAVRDRDGKATKQKRRNFVGYLPAIPIVITGK